MTVCNESLACRRHLLVNSLLAFAYLGIVSGDRSNSWSSIEGQDPELVHQVIKISILLASHGAMQGSACSKVIAQSTYVRRVPQCTVCSFVGIGTLPSPLSPASVPLPPEPRAGGTLACGWGVGVVPIPTTGGKA
jgi:hypothetical protein